MPQFLIYTLIFGGVGGLIVLILALIWRAQARKEKEKENQDNQ